MVVVIVVVVVVAVVVVAKTSEGFLDGPNVYGV